MRSNTTQEFELPRLAEPVRGLYQVNNKQAHNFSSFVQGGQPKSILKIGRHRSCDIPLWHPTVSIVHCVAIRQGEHWELKDESSRNGLYVNDVRVESIILQPQMRVRLGSVELVVYGASLTIPVTATSYTSFLARAAGQYATVKEAAAKVHKSKSTLQRAVRRMIRRSAGNAECEKP
jgi:pSer/pThr/pTyr-binding forkhead associated (FHA) protein